MPRPRADICKVSCPSRHILELLAEKWVLLVIFRLRAKPHRTSELRREIGGVSEKMLIQTLRKLERFGLIARNDYGEVPPRVDYELTKLGRSLSDPVEQLERWVAGNLVELLRSKEKFDTKSAARVDGSAARLARTA
jgi:DNA-binding HxlR family transcriptional regulator